MYSFYAHMEDWLQCEWWDWQVYTANVTEQYAQIAVVGPNARKVLEKLGVINTGIYYFMPITRLITVTLLIPKTRFNIVHAKGRLIISSYP